uniref:SFRICE_030572 n=1 Tax=Spodoptera frugiperda TaxID=7108 RepID=A0A2H1W259_SPOFR
MIVEHSSEGLHQERQETPTSDLGAPQNLSPWAIAPSCPPNAGTAAKEEAMLPPVSLELGSSNPLVCRQKPDDGEEKWRLILEQRKQNFLASLQGP